MRKISGKYGKPYHRILYQLQCVRILLKQNQLEDFFLLKLFFQNRVFLIDYFSGLKFRINMNSNLAILMIPGPHNYIFGSRMLQILQFSCWIAEESRPLMPSPFSLRKKDSPFMQLSLKLQLDHFTDFTNILKMKTSKT